MRKWNYFLAALVWAILCRHGYLWAQKQQKPQPQQAAVEFTSTNVEKAIEKGCAWLWKQQRADGSWPELVLDKWATMVHQGTTYKTYKIGPTAFAIYTLLASGASAKDDKIQKALDWLVKNEATPTEKNPDWTYNKTFACLAYYAAEKQLKDRKYLKQLEADVKTLCASHGAGKYGYFVTNSPSRGYYDNSNCQYAMYAAWAGARAGLEIPREYWDTCLKHWINEQQTDGSWKYTSVKPREPDPHMTVAGLASLFVCVDFLHGDKFDKCQGANELAAIKKGMEYMEKNFDTSLDGRYDRNLHYYLYGVERVGLAGGYKYFGASDWYRTGATWLLGTQDANGSWKSGMVGRVKEDSCPLAGDFDSTCYALLFLARGRLPVLLNRLDYDGDWNNRPRALANLCRWSESVFEKDEVNWQIITLRSVPEEWHDAPVLVITGSKAPKFSGEDVAKLRAYVNQGGMLLGITECGGGAFGRGMREVYQKLFPKYELRECGRDHILNTIQYKLPPTIKMFELGNGIRPLIIHTDADLPLAWQRYNVATMKPSFEAAANVLMYVTDRQLKSRGDKFWPAEPSKTAGRTVKAARIRYAGNYDPEPLAIQRLSRMLWKNYDVRLDCQDVTQSAGAPASGPAAGIPITGITATELTAEIRIAFLTGTGAISASQAEKDALKKWVDGGGLLFVDAGGGAKAFSDSARDLIGELWGADSLLVLPLSSPVYQMKDMTIEKVKYHRATKVRIGPSREPGLQTVMAGDRPKVIFSAEDLTGGLVGYSTFGMDGYEPQSAFDVMRNVVLYAASAPSLPASGPSSAPASQAASVPAGK